TDRRDRHSFPTRRSSDLAEMQRTAALGGAGVPGAGCDPRADLSCLALQAAASGALQQNAAPTMTPAPQAKPAQPQAPLPDYSSRSEEHTSELQSLRHLVC